MAKAIARRTRVLLVLAAASAVYPLYQLRPDPVRSSSTPAVVARLLETEHYAITSTATDSQTALVGAAVESLHTAFTNFFPKVGRVRPDQSKLLLRLYKDQAEFKQYNKAAFWAEAYYLAPTCHAYFAADEENPYHWMNHEAIHQLNHQLALFSNAKWIDEGLATYFGTSSIRDGKMIPGRIDVHTYPIWVVAKLSLTGDLTRDVERGKLIGLRKLIGDVAGTGMDGKVNAYYVGFWSLSHFLFHFDEGRYAAKYAQLLTTPGTIEDFERIVGPIERIEGEWYGYLQTQVALTKTN
jgi:hypothetical protein